MTPSTSLSAIDAVTSVIGPVGEERPEVVEGRREGRGAGRVVGAVEQDLATADVEQLEPARPARRRVAAAPGVVADRGDAGGLERVEERVGDGDVRGLVPAAQADPGPAEPRQLDLDPVAVPAEERRRRDLGQRDAQPPRPAPDDGERLAASRRSPRGRPRSMIAAFSRAIVGDRRAEPVHVVEVDVRDRRRRRRPRRGSRRGGRRARPRRARRPGPASAKWRKTTAVSSSNSVGSPRRRATRSADRQRPPRRGGRSRRRRSAGRRPRSARGR